MRFIYILAICFSLILSANILKQEPNLTATQIKAINEAEVEFLKAQAEIEIAVNESRSKVAPAVIIVEEVTTAVLGLITMFIFGYVAQQLINLIIKKLKKNEAKATLQKEGKKDGET